MSDPQLPAVVDLTAYHGDTWTQLFRLKQGDVAVDLTGATVAAAALSSRGVQVVLAATVTNAAAGEVQIAVGPAGLASGSYTYDVEITQAAVVTTWVRGVLTVTSDITNSAA